jgi:murein DD-endopeptidase MepM/ murein hydrolase activator NlpD
LAGDLIIDLRPRPPSLVQHDDGRDPGAPAAPATSFRSSGPSNLDRIQLAPWPPVQGQTLVVTVQAREPVTYSLSFLGQPYPVHAGNAGAWAFAPIPALQKIGYSPLTLRAGDQELTVNVPVQAGKFETINIPAATAAPILSNTAKVNAETARTTKLFAGMTEGGWAPRSRFDEPLHGQFRHTSPFGSRRTYGNDPTLSYHAGEDFSAIAGTPVYAPYEGTVVLAEKLFVRGNAVVLDHGNGVYTGYWHMSELDVKPGEHVKPGQLLGKVGSTGLSTGAHLHWEMRVDGMAVDPLQWVGEK